MLKILRDIIVRVFNLIYDRPAKEREIFTLEHFVL